MSRDEPAERRPAAKADGSRLLVAIAYALLSIVALGGLLIGDYPLAVDFPNHAARLFIECNQVDPAFSRMYAVEYSLIPNLAIDVMYQPLCGLADPMSFLRATLVATMAGILLMVWMLHIALNERPNAFVLLAPAMTFNLVTSMGYLNYLIGTLLFLIFAWAMLRWDLLKRPALAVALGNGLGLLIFFCHIFALALAVVFLFGLRFAAEADQPLLRRGAKAALMTGACFAAPLLLTLMADSSGFGPIYRLGAKIRMFWAPVFFSSVPVAGALTFLWVALFYWAFRERQVAISPVLRWPLVLLAGFAILLPSALRNAVDLDSRCLVSVGFLALAGLSAHSGLGGQVPKIAQRAAALVASTTLAVHLVVLTPQATAYGRQVTEFRQAIRLIPPSAPVLSIANMESTPPAPLRFYSHMASYTTRDRKAFNPGEFDGKGMQPMRVLPGFACIDVPGGPLVPVHVANGLLQTDGRKLLERPEYGRFGYALNWDRNFSYVVHYHFGSGGAVPASAARLVHEGSFFTIYRTAGEPKLEGPCGVSTSRG